MHFGRFQLRDVACIGVGILLAGCAGEHYSNSRGIALSEAMTASASAGSGNLASPPASGGGSYAYGGEWSFAASDEASIPAVPPDSASDYESYVVSFSAEEVLPIANDIRNISRFEFVPFGFQGEQEYLGIYVGGGDIQFRSGSFPDRAVKNPWLLDAGMMGRYYFTPPKTFVSPFISGGVFSQMVVWDYRTPLILGGEIIRSDAIYGGGGYVGLGLTLARKETFGLFAEARLGFNLYDNATTQGFYNDVLKDYGYFSVRAGVNIRF